jgi:cobalt-zinc-cadmium efflux system protein
LWAASLAARPAKGIWTFGLKRAEILSAAANGLSLALVAVVIAVEAVVRLVHPSPVDGLIVLVVALTGAAVDLAATLVLARASRTSLNVRGAFVHMVTDLYAFAGTAVAGVVIMVTGFRQADALASLVIVALMARAAWCLIRDSGRILLQGTPDRVDLTVVRAHLMAVDHVVGVHDLHAWTVTSGLPSLSAHVVVDDSCFATGHAPQILDQLQACVGAHFEVEHATFQLEPATHAGHEPGTHH